MKKNRLVVIGNSAAGLACLEAIREADKYAEIINISREQYRPYSRCLLTYYLSGEITQDRLWIRPDNYYKDLDIEPILNTEIIHIDEKNKKLKLADKKIIDYDKLLFAAGGTPTRLQMKGIEKRNVFYLRTIEDADGILSQLKDIEKVVILGGGLIGMRTAHSLRKRGKKVQVVVKSKHTFSQILDFESSDMIRSHFETNGVEIFTGLEAVEILGVDAVQGVLLDDGNRLDCQLIVIGKGVSPNLELLQGKVNINKGILVDRHLSTSDRSIYAAGDVAETYDLFRESEEINALWPQAIRQGKIAGLNMAGRAANYDGSYGMNAVDFFGLAIISFGIIRPDRRGQEIYEELIQADFSRNIYRKVVLKDNIIVGGILVNDVERHGLILNLALQKVDLSEVKDILADEYFDYAKVIPLMKNQRQNFKRPEYEDTALTYAPVFEEVF